jgi:hypothetical protein
VQGYVGLGFGGFVVVVLELGFGLVVADYISDCVHSGTDALTLETLLGQVEEEGEQVDGALDAESVDANDEIQHVEVGASREVVHQRVVLAAYLDSEAMALLGVEQTGRTVHLGKVGHMGWEADLDQKLPGAGKLVPGVWRVGILP